MFLNFTKGTPRFTIDGKSKKCIQTKIYKIYSEQGQGYSSYNGLHQYLALCVCVWLLELEGWRQGVTKRYRLSWLTNSVLVYEPTCRGRKLRGLS